MKLNAMLALASLSVFFVASCAKKEGDTSAAARTSPTQAEGYVSMPEKRVNSYPEETAAEFFAKCEEGGGEAETCGCIFEKMEATFTLEEFEEIESQRRAGAASGDNIRAADAITTECINEQNAGLEAHHADVFSPAMAGNASQADSSDEQKADVSPPPYGWNFLLSMCFYVGENLQKCDEYHARQGERAGVFQVFGESRIDIYSFDPASIPAQYRKDQHIVLENVQYQYDEPTKGVVVRTSTEKGCIDSYLFVPWSSQVVRRKTLGLTGTCSEIQKQINDRLQMLDKSMGPTALYIAQRP